MKNDEQNENFRLRMQKTMSDVVYKIQNTKYKVQSTKTMMMFVIYHTSKLKNAYLKHQLITQ